MAYNRRYIQKKGCKHPGCPNMPKLGCGGYCWKHKAEDSGFERKQARSAVKETEKKLRMLPNSIAVDQVEIDEKVKKENWFRSIRPKLTGTCQCGCGGRSSKEDYRAADGKIVSQFRSSICHIFPKCDFHSVKFHPLNYVERAFWGGCHSNMDNQSMDRWPGMADWDDIKEKFFILAPLLTDKERSLKFYTHLERLIYTKA